MTPGRRSRGELRDAMLEQTLDQEEKLVDLRAALAALTVMASASGGIQPDDMPGLRYVARGGRDLADSLHQAWRGAVERLGTRQDVNRP